MTKRPGPVLIELEDAPQVSPAEAPPVIDAPLRPAAMERAVQIAAAKPSRLARWFWAVLLTLIGFVVSVAAWDFVTGLLARGLPVRT